MFKKKLYLRIPVLRFQHVINRFINNMPYRRLPNTDNARFKALKNALEKGKELPPFKLAFSQQTLQKVLSFLPAFEQTMLLQKQAYTFQVEKNKDYQQTLRKAKLYISHFIQVLNMAILRAELPENTRSFYGLRSYGKNVPPLNTETEILTWGQKLIDGETTRLLDGLSPITNPTVAVVKVRYEQFLDAYKFQKTLQKRNHYNLEKLASFRSKADDIILSIWNEVEKTYKDLPDDLKREKAKQYGIVYIFRKNEIPKISRFETNQKEIG